MDIDYALPGHLVAAVFEVLLIDAGYQVIPTGIERSLRELRTIDAAAYRELAHPRLRFAPDFFVLDVEARQGWLTEIKFRQYIHPRLFDDLQIVQKDWAPFVLLLAVAEPPQEWTGTVRHIRVFEIDSATHLDQQFFREAGRRIQDVFARLGDRWEDGTILKAQEAILRITAKQ